MRVRGGWEKRRAIYMQWGTLGMDDTMAISCVKWRDGKKGTGKNGPGS